MSAWKPALYPDGNFVPGTFEKEAGRVPVLVAAVT
jgi:hypothetical protein